MHLTTFSIVAYDPTEQAFGVAVASKFLAVGAVVGWAKAGVGAVATQALAKIGFGPDGLALMGQEYSAQTALDMLLASDLAREHRQVALVDTAGRAAAHTGKECFDFAGHKIGEGFSCQGNILTGPDVLEAMAAAFTSAPGEFADRLMAALRAGNDAGGDKRGKQSAALQVVRPNGGYGGDTDRYLDLRVDDDADPVRKLEDLVNLHHLFLGKPRPEDEVEIGDEVARELQTILLNQGYYTGEVNGSWDDATKWALWALVGNENLEERWNIDQQAHTIDRIALEYIRKRFSQ